MANKKRVSVNTIDAAKDKETAKIIDWDGLEITVTNTIGFGDMVKFVNETVNSCFSKDGSYNPEAKDFAFRLNIIEKYTDIRLPDNVEAQYWFVYGTGIVDKIIGLINPVQIDSIMKAVEEKASNRAHANIEAIMKRLEEVSAAFDGMQAQLAEQLKAALGGIDPDDLSKLAASMTDGELDEDKIVKAYLDQSYAKADGGEE